MQDFAAIKKNTFVKTNLNTTLQSATQSWYTAKLSNLEQSNLRSIANGIEAWCFFLTAHFKKLSRVALTKLTSEKYTVKDARNRKEPASYIETIMCHAKAANINKMLNQLTFAHEKMAPELKVFVDPSSKLTSIFLFIKMLKLKKNTWFNLHLIIQHSKESKLLF